MDYLVQVTAKAEVIADVYVTANTLTFAADAALEMAQHDEVDWRYHGDSEDHEVFDVLVSPNDDAPFAVITIVEGNVVSVKLAEDRATADRLSKEIAKEQRCDATEEAIQEQLDGTGMFRSFLGVPLAIMVIQVSS